MVDISQKKATLRTATARAFVAMSREVIQALPNNAKGDPLQIARIAGISAAKKTSDLIPLCHPLSLVHCEVRLELVPSERRVVVQAEAEVIDRTGVEMEAMVAASVAALTVYDMCKALDKGIEIREVVLEQKSGGKSGDYKRKRI